MLRLLVELVRDVASTLQMIRRRPPVIGTQAMPASLPGEKTDTFKETTLAAANSTPIALMLRSAAKLRVSKDEGVLTIASHTSPSLSVSLTTSAIHLPLLRMGRQAPLTGNEGELPPPVRRIGGGGLRALARKTEEARASISVPT